MSEAIVFSNSVVVDSRLVRSDGHNLSRNLEQALNFDDNTVGVAVPSNGGCGRSRGLPGGTFDGGEADRLAVKGKGKAVDVVVPGSGFLGAEKEFVITEEDGDGLDPSEVPPHVLVSSSDEVGIDVKVGVGYEAEIAVLLAMEVESDAVAADESRVLAHRSGHVAFCIYIFQIC